GCSLDVIEGDAEFVLEEPAHVEKHCEHADGSRKRERVIDDGLCGGSDPISTRRCKAAHRYDDRFLLGREADGTPDLVGSRSRTAGRVDAHDHRADTVVLAGLLKGPFHRLRAHALLAERAGAAVLAADD